MNSYGDLRGWIDQVDKLGELLRISGAHWNGEMGAITHMLTEKSRGHAPAILFDDIPGYPKGYRTLYGHFSSVRRVALTLGLPLEYERKVDIVKKYYERIQSTTPLAPRWVKDGPTGEHCRGRQSERTPVSCAPPPRAGQGTLHRHGELRDHSGSR